MSIHYKGIMVIIPALVTSIFLGAFWRRFNAAAASVSMVGGSIFTLMTVWYPEWIDPLARFVGGSVNGEYIYMRALFGMVVTAVIGIFVTFVTRKADKKHSLGLTADTLDEAMKHYKGGAEPNHELGEPVRDLEFEIDNKLKTSHIKVSKETMEAMSARPGDLIYLSDNRWILGGLRSDHVFLDGTHSKGKNLVILSEETKDLAYLLDHKQVMVEKIL